MGVSKVPSLSCRSQNIMYVDEDVVFVPFCPFRIFRGYEI